MTAAWDGERRYTRAWYLMLAATASFLLLTGGFIWGRISGVSTLQLIQTQVRVIHQTGVLPEDDFHFKRGSLGSSTQESAVGRAASTVGGSEGVFDRDKIVAEQGEREDILWPSDRKTSQEESGGKGWVEKSETVKYLANRELEGGSARETESLREGNGISIGAETENSWIQGRGMVLGADGFPTAEWKWETMPVPEGFHNPDAELPVNSPPDLWDIPPDEGWRACDERPGDHIGLPEGGSQGYISAELDGGLCQQILEMCDAVALARILNATLVLPDLKYDLFWKDSTRMSEVIDVDYFRKTLEADVRIVTREELPAGLQEKDTWQVAKKTYLGTPEEYRSFAPLLSPANVLFFRYPFFEPLAHQLTPRLDKLRCRTKYRALRFAPDVLAVGDRVMSRMRAEGDGRFLALHLRFEEDRVAASWCDYGQTPEEEARLERIRGERDWRPAWQGIANVTTEEQKWAGGWCPASPGMVAKWLRALGYGPETAVYIAAGEVWKSHVHMASFKALFPRVFTKEALFTPEDATWLKGKSNLLAAVDAHVMVNAPVAAITLWGQMTWYVVGHRAWLGHKKRVTIPLWRLPGLDDEGWESYQSELRKWDFYGAPRNRTAEPFAVPIYGNPVPNCMCQPEGGPLPFNSRTCKSDAYKCVDER
ncbi:O-fucosyltransferase family protein [Klebsormidium nitens]|uniref:O-fucosyltransferase family protein n=1 Tax=Klebsormidium nitens TaxID=105231 RepID=A0A1Y1I1N7_KLENI|nr:O-fucosyltransferase family protein [Klebsormidium nitens]|eukprot:GAQ83872.1 O-fucosyltransferase family protein [Klebsormidium nitens]